MTKIRRRTRVARAPTESAAVDKDSNLTDRLTQIGRVRQTIFEAPSIADAIRRGRESLGLSQRELARQMGVTGGAVAQWEGEGDRYRPPMIDNLWGLSRVLGIPINELLGVPAGRVGAPAATEAPAVRAEDRTEVELLALFRVLPKEKKADILARVYAALGAGEPSA